MKRRLLAFLAPAIVLVTVVLILRWFFADFRDVTDTGEYRSVLSKLRDWRGVAHFPPSIPPAARDVSFFHRPGIMQAATLVELRCTLPAAEYDAVVRGLPAPSTRPAESSIPRFRPVPEPFRIHVLGARDEASGNHGESFGIAVDPATRRVIYFAEQW